jgi:predicted ArsR family transcriptional regulator
MHPSWLEVLGDPIRIRLLEGLVAAGEASAVELAAQINTSEPSLRRHLETMAALGLVVERPGMRDGLTPGRPASRFRLQPEVRERAIMLFSLTADPLVP